MDRLCPECAHLLYGYPNCDHAFVDGRCSKCGWDGSRSDFLKLTKERARDPHPAVDPTVIEKLLHNPKHDSRTSGTQDYKVDASS